MAGAALDASALDAAESIVRECPHPYRLQDVHNGVVDDTVRIIGQTENDAFLWLIDLEYLIL